MLENPHEFAAGLLSILIFHGSEHPAVAVDFVYAEIADALFGEKDND